MICSRCEGDGKAHGSDRPFEWSGLGTYPGPCPVCKGSGRVGSDVLQEALIRSYNLRDDIVFDRVVSIVGKLAASTQEALGLIGGWRQAAGLLEYHTADSVLLKNMMAAIDQMDDWKKTAKEVLDDCAVFIDRMEIKEN